MCLSSPPGCNTSSWHVGPEAAGGAPSSPPTAGLTEEFIAAAPFALMRRSWTSAGEMRCRYSGAVSPGLRCIPTAPPAPDAPPENDVDVETGQRSALAEAIREATIEGSPPGWRVACESTVTCLEAPATGASCQPILAGEDTPRVDPSAVVAFIERHATCTTCNGSPS